jgi:hypothetical protein
VTPQVRIQKWWENLVNMWASPSLEQHWPELSTMMEILHIYTMLGDSSYWLLHVYTFFKQRHWPCVLDTTKRFVSNLQSWKTQGYAPEQRETCLLPDTKDGCSLNSGFLPCMAIYCVYRYHLAVFELLIEIGAQDSEAKKCWYSGF